MTFIDKYQIKQIYYSKNKSHLTEYFNISKFNNDYDNLLMIGIDINIIKKHKSNIYILWNDIDDINNFNTQLDILIKRHFIFSNYLKYYLDNREISYELVNYDFNVNYKFIIVSNKIINSISEFLKENLDTLGYKSKIIFNMNQVLELSRYIFILIDKIFFFKNVPPNNFIFYQLEQNNSLWFTKKYINLMNSSYKIFDFSNANNIYFDKILDKNKIFINNLPLSRLIEKTKHEFDFLFFGTMNNRRNNIINNLRDKFNIISKTKIFGEDKNNLIKKCKIVINIHYYEDACLETCRINECLKYNKLIISEEPNSNDLFNKELYKNVIYFEKINDNLSNINKLIDCMNYALNNYDNLINNLNTIDIYNFCNQNLKNNIDNIMNYVN